MAEVVIGADSWRLSPARRSILLEHDVKASDIDVQPWGSFVTFADPDGNTWALQQLPPRP